MTLKSDFLSFFLSTSSLIYRFPSRSLAPSSLLHHLSTAKYGSHQPEREVAKVLMMMKSASLLWVGAVEKSEQSSVGVGSNRAELLSSSMVLGRSNATENRTNRKID